MLTPQINLPIQSIEDLYLPRGGDDEPCSPTQYRHYTMLKITTSPIHIIANLVALKGYIPHATNILKPVLGAFFLRHHAKAIYD
jgi:hypothetical protein